MHTAAATKVRTGTVHWIDHFVICSEDVPRWGKFCEKLLGASDVADPEGQIPGIFQNVGRSRFGCFKMLHPMPPPKPVGTGFPRYGLYIDAADIPDHLRRLDELGAPHTQPVRTSADGESGTEICWQDPDGNQFSFWAPDATPPGAMTGCSSTRVGRISHVVFQARDFERTAALFERFCGVVRVTGPEIADDTLVLRLGGGARVVYKRVTTLDARTTGLGLRDTHTALLVHDDEFIPTYRRLFAGLPEWDFDPIAGKKVENPEALPARTVLHPSMAGRRFHGIVNRGDDFFDWDTNLFHFFGGKPVDGDSLAVYEGHPVESFIDAWIGEHGSTDGFKEHLLR